MAQISKLLCCVCPISLTASLWLSKTDVVKSEDARGAISQPLVPGNSTLTSPASPTAVPVLCRADGSVGQTGPAGAPQQHSPAHTDAVTSVAALTPDLCVSGGRDKVRYPLGQENISMGSKIRVKCEL